MKNSQKSKIIIIIIMQKKKKLYPNGWQRNPPPDPKRPPKRNCPYNHRSITCLLMIKNWRVGLTAGGISLTEVKIQRRIFLGDTLSPILFLMATMQFNFFFYAFFFVSRSRWGPSDQPMIEDGICKCADG